MALDAATRERIVADSATIIARYPQPRSALLPMLHLMQSVEGYVSPDGIALAAEILGMSTAEVSAVSTFYTQYKRHPNGEYTVGVCTNTLCAVLGGDTIFAELSEHLGVGHDETTEDGRVTLERVECNAACDYAPVMMVNWEFFDNQTPSSARDIVDALQAGQDVVPTRGASSVCTFKQVSRLLAGFDDGRADEGVSAGPASVVGLDLAHRNGWTAPSASKGAKGKAGVGADREPARTETSAHDAPVAKGERAGTVTGKPSGDATRGEGDQSSAADGATGEEG
jgi:NADH-quinone oxidoreductase subunit E